MIYNTVKFKRGINHQPPSATECAEQANSMGDRRIPTTLLSLLGLYCETDENDFCHRQRRGKKHGDFMIDKCTKAVSLCHIMHPVFVSRDRQTLLELDIEAKHFIKLTTPCKHGLLFTLSRVENHGSVTMQRRQTKEETGVLMVLVVKEPKSKSAFSLSGRVVL